ncbi:MFS transporter, partial [Rhizobiaceae sp. 2RAB30]
VLADPTLRQAEGVVLLAQQVTREAYAMAYADAFFVVFVASASAVVFLLVHSGWKYLAGLSRPIPQT